MTVNVEGVGPVTFPDGTSREDMDKALRERFAPKPQSSSLGAGLRSFASGILPTAAAVGTEALLAPESLGASLLAIPPTIAAGYGAGKLQQKAIQKFAPKIAEQQQADIQQHPVATAVGEVASGLPFMKLAPGTLFKNPKAAVLPAAIGATVGAVSPLLEGQKPTTRDIAEGVAFGTLYGKPRFRALPKATAAAAKAIGEKNAREIELAHSGVSGRIPASQEKTREPSVGTAAKPLQTQTATGNLPAQAELGGLGVGAAQQNISTSETAGGLGTSISGQGSSGWQPRAEQSVSGLRSILASSGLRSILPLESVRQLESDLIGPADLQNPARGVQVLTELSRAGVTPEEIQKSFVGLTTAQRGATNTQLWSSLREQLLKQKESEYASKKREAETLHGPLRPQQAPTGELPKPESVGGVQPPTEGGIQKEAGPQQTGELGLTDEEADYLEQERQGLDVKTKIVPQNALGGDNEPFAASQIARSNRKTGEIEVNAPAYKQWLAEMRPEQRQQAVRSLLAEERIHLGVSDEQAGDYWKNLTALEKAAERKAYTNNWRGLHPDTGERISDTLMGHEAVRRRLQQLARMPTTEVAALVGRERLSLQAIEALSRTVRAIREGLGTKASRDQFVIIDHIQDNLDAAKAAAAQQPAALRRPRKGEERNQPTFELPGYAPGQEMERPTAEQAGAASKHAAEGTIHPEDLYFRDEPSPEEGEHDITERKEREDRRKSQAYQEIPEELRGNVKRLNSLLTQDARVSGGNVEDTRRLTALVNKRTKEVSLVSTFLRGPRGTRPAEAWVRNPDPQIPGNKRLADVLTDYTPTHSFLAQEGRNKFIQTWPDISTFENEFANPAKDVIHGRISSPEPSSGVGWEFDEEGNPKRVPMAPTAPGMAYYEQPLTPGEALSVIEHARGESGEIESPEDIVASIDAVTRDVRQATGVGANDARKVYAQMAVEIDRKNPELTTEQKLNKLAQQVYDNYATAKDPETFIRRTIEATGRPYLESPASTVPQVQGQARELTMPRFARKAVPAEPFTAQPKAPGQPQPTTFGMEHPTYQATTAEGQTPIPTAREALQARTRYEYEQRQKARQLEAARMEQDPFKRLDKLAESEPLLKNQPAALNARVKAAKDELSIVGDNLKAIYQRRGTKQNIARGVDAQDNAAKTTASVAKDAIILDSGEDISKPTQSSVLARGIRAHSAEVKGKRTEALKRREASLAVKSSMEGPGPGQEVPNLNKLNMFEQQTRQGLIKAERAAKSINPIERRQGRKDIEYGNRLLEGIEYARTHWHDPDFQKAAESFVREMDDELLTENANGLDVTWRSGQVPGYYENDGFFSDKNVIFNRRGILGTAFGKPKVFKDIYEAFATGGHFRLASLDSADIANHRISRGQYAIGQQKTIQQLKRMRDPVSRKPILMDMQPIMETKDVTGPMVARGGIVTPHQATVQTPVQTGRFKVPEGHPEYTPIEIGTGARVAVRRGYEGFVKSVFGQSGLNQLVIGDVPVGQAAMQLSQVLKHQVIALFDTFHPGRMLQYATALKAGPKYEGGWAATHYRESDLQRAVNQGYITQDAADWAKQQHPVKLGPRTQMRSMHWIINNLLVKEGLNSAHNRDVLLEASTAHLPIIGESWQKLLRPYNVGLFEHLIPGLMNEAAGRRFVEMQTKNPNIPAKTLAKDIIKDTNVFFGNMGRQGIFQNKLFSDLATTTFFAPRWLEGLVQKELRFASRATGLSYLLGRREPSYFGMLGEGMAKGLGAYFIGTQLINLISRGHFTWDNPEEDHKMDAYIKPPWSKDGFWLSPMSVFAEVTHDIIRLSESKPRVLDALKQFGENRLGPIGKMEQILRTGRSPTGEQYSTSAGELGGALSQLAPAPISFGPLARGLGHAIAPSLVSPQLPGSITRQVIAGSLGVKAEREKSPLQQIASKARDFAEKEGYSKETGWQEIMTDQPSYSKLRLALRNDDQKEAVRQWRELRKTHSEDQIVHAMKLWAKKPLTGSARGERAFIYSLDNRDLERYWQANQQRQTELERFYDFYTRQ